ncbi:MAG: TlpA family protein disulfide reductase [Cellvibrionaceae bacterium]
MHLKTVLVNLLRVILINAILVLPVHAVDVGDTATVIPLPLLVNKTAGKNTSIKDFKGKLVYLDFWASWCGPCRKSLPILNDIRKNYSDQGFEVVAINVDENLNDALKFLKKYPVDYPILLDSKGLSPRSYQVKGMPTAYLIDEKGIIIYKHTGFKKKDKKKIEALIDKHLAKR